MQHATSDETQAETSTPKNAAHKHAAPEKTTRHDYKARPAAHWDNGYFSPASPKPVEKHPDSWTFRDKIDSTLALSRNPVIATTRITRQAPYVKAAMFGQTLIVACEPAIIKYIFVERAENYGLNSIRQAILKPILKNGLLTAEGRVWKRARRALSPIFAPRHMANFAPRMQATVTRELPALFAQNTAGGKTNVDFNAQMLRLAYLVLSDTLFSGEIDGETDAVLRDVGQFLTALGKPDPLDIFGAPNFIPRPTKLRGFGAVRRLRRLVTKLSSDRRARIDAGQAVPDDFLTLLLQTQDADGPLSDAEIEDHIVTFIGAGHETTSRAMTWMAYLLSQDTDARTRIEAELDAMDMTAAPETWAAQMPWAMACFSETMRLYPPAPIISRYAVEADEYDGVPIPKDCSVMINLWALHRHEKLWDYPDSFVPARFLDDAPQRIDRFQYLPFGLGHRVCIGQRFAMQEAAILIALIFRNYRFDFAGDTDPWPLMRITVQPEDGMPMTVSARS